MRIGSTKRILVTGGGGFLGGHLWEPGTPLRKGLTHTIEYFRAALRSAA
jgi:hypothetical protein